MKKWDWNIAHWNGKQKLMTFFVLWVVIALLCWFFIPGWQGLPGGPLILAGVVAVGVIGFLANLVAYLKEPTPPSSNPTITEIDTGGGAQIGGNLTQGPGSTFVGRDSVQAGTFIAEQKNYAAPDPEAEKITVGDIHHNTNSPINVGSGTQTTTYNIGEQHIHPAPEQEDQNRAATALLSAYFGALAARCQDLPLGRVHPRFAQSTTKGSVSLQTVYTDLDVVRPPREKDLDIRRLGMKLERADGGERQPLLKVMADPKRRRFALLGSAGSGKTTFVNYLTFALAQSASNQPAPELPEALQGLLPVRIILRHIAASIPVNAACGEPEMIWKALRKDMETLLGDLGAAQLFPVFQQRILQQGAMILLDGLDEVPEAGQRRKCLLEAIQSWLKCFNGVQPRVLLTARPYAYADPTWQLPDFEMLSLAPFNEEQIGNFVDHWYQAARPAIGWDADTAAGRGSLLKQAIQQRPYLADLASRPLLLTLTAAIDTGGGKLPEDRADLYEEAVNLLLLRWQIGSEIRDAEGKLISDDQITRVQAIPEEQKRRAIEKLAFQVHERQGQAQNRSDASADIPAADIYAVFNPLLPDNFNAKVLLGFLETRAGLLIGRSEEIYTFLHRSFQEYLAGCHLLGSDNFADRMKTLLASDRDWWRDVCLLAVGAASKSGRTMPFALGILDEFVPGNPEEAAQITAEQQRLAALTGTALLELRVPERASESGKARLVQNRTTRWLVNILQTGRLPAQERAEGGNILARLGDPRPEVLTCEGMAFCEVPAGEFIIGEGKKPKTLTLPGFWIGKYPVTVAQFDQFVQAGGYTHPDYWAEAIKEKYWTQAGFKGRYDDEPRTAPFPLPLPFTLPNHPVVGITWYEAMAYTRWLNQYLLRCAAGRSGSPWPELAAGKLKVALPTHEQWEKAARGTDGRTYPWGADFDSDRANTAESGIGATSAVGCFPGGVSPYGDLDLSGNVWEWVLMYPSYLRGGSWNYNQGDARCAYRARNDPGRRFNLIGFRVSLSPL